MLLGLLFQRRVKEIDGERLKDKKMKMRRRAWQIAAHHDDKSLFFWSLFEVDGAAPSCVDVGDKVFDGDSKM